MRSPRLALALALLLSARVGAAQGAPADEQPRPGAPEQHFEHALEHYRAGRYRAAIQALNAAIVLDPKSKDLFFNLALVYEKLGELDRAIVALGRYLSLETDPAELERATHAIVRMRGARAEAAIAPEAAPARPVRVQYREAAPEPSAARPRVDAWLLGGTALALSPESRSSAADAERQRKSEQSARISNIAFSVSLLSGAGTALLWFTRAPPSCPSVAAPVGVSFQGAF